MMQEHKKLTLDKLMIKVKTLFNLTTLIDHNDNEVMLLSFKQIKSQKSKF